MTDSFNGRAENELHPVLSRPPVIPYCRELYKRRQLILAIPRNALRAQNMHTVLGNFWYLLNPALQTVVYFFVFGFLFDANRGISNYLGYLVIGVLTFNVIGQALTSASRCIVNYQSLIRSLYFPRTAVPIASGLSNIYTFLPSILIFIFIAVLTGETPQLRWLFIPVALLITCTWLFGLVFIFARLGRGIPDLHSLLPHVVRLLFYLSGTLFDPVVLVANKTMLFFCNLNPFFQLLSMWRWILLGRPMLGWMWGSLIAWSICTFILGFLYFWQAETDYGSER
jgi:teichoic acid transport system permease protein|tara:strand:- start:549 stop:1397 length:849 start_codon:yes stop_codon:yes gene_type:complete